MQPRDLAAELAHLREWWATRPLLTVPAVSVAVGLHRNTLGQALRTGKVTSQLLDTIYPMLGRYGYEPLSNDYLFL